MKDVIRRINIDLYAPKIYEVIRAQQGDDKSRCVEFELYDQGNPYEITNDTIANVEGLRADGSGYIKSCEINNNIITFVLDDNLLYYDGAAKLKLVLYSDNKKVLSSIPFKVSIERNPIFNIKFKKDEYSLINDVLNMVGEMDSEVNNNTNAIMDINDNLSSEISRAKEADEILKSRVDVITSLPEGSTTGDAELQDIRVKADGTTATSAGNAVREQFNELKSDLAQLGFSSNIMTSDFVDNHYRDYRDGVDKAHHSYCEWDIKPIKSDSTYYFNTDAHITFFSNDNYSFISGVEIVGEGTFQTPSNASYITISFPMIKKEQVILSENKKPIFNIPIGVSTAEAIKKELDSKTSSNNIYVGANKDYTSLVECFEYIRKNNLKDITVMIDNGVYNLIDEVVSVYGQSFIDNFTESTYYDVNEFKGLFLGNNIKVIGNGKVVINCEYNGSNDNFKLYFSPFHVYNHSYSIKGIKIIASNVRYCLHDDSYVSYGNNTGIIEKCEFVDNGTRAGACIGGGFTKGNDLVYIDNCLFKSTSSNDIGFYYHTNPSSGECTIKSNNCYFENCKCFISAYGNSSNRSRLFISNSSMPIAPYKTKSELNAVDNVDLYAWNNEISN